MTRAYTYFSLALAAASPAFAQESGDASRGLTYARDLCAACHAVLAIDAKSPRPDAPPFKAVANTPGMTGTALAVWLRTPHKSMPNLIIEPGDLNNVIAYIVSLREKRPM